MAETITIEVGDDKSITISVAEDGKPMGEPYTAKDPADAAKFLDSILNEENDEGAQEEKTEGPEDYAKAWNEEAKSRHAQPGIMA